MKPEEVERPLARFGGARPEAPDWYRTLQLEPEQIIFPVVEGARLELLVWGEVGRPGVLLAHGSAAHARWWGPVAPLLARHYRVASLSWSGMGGSDWRADYSLDQQVRELFAAAEAGGLLGTGTPPVFIAHSFGSRALVQAAAERGGELSGAVVVDGMILPGRVPRQTVMRVQQNYASAAEALARFNLKPSQPCANPFILDDVARASLEETGEGWRWRLDPEFFRKFDYRDVWPALARAQCRLAFVHGGESAVLTPEGLAAQKSQAPAGTPFVRIPLAGHHVMLDQPVALAAALHGLVETWLSQ